MPSPLPGKREVEVAGVRGAPVVSCSGEWGPRTACWGQLVGKQKVTVKLEGLKLLCSQI